MAERFIVQLGDPILREKSKPVKIINQNVYKLLDDMVDTIYAAPGRAGLSAIQVGIPKQLVVMDCGSGLIELINPVILEKVGEEEGTEACLSIPGVVGLVKRAQYVKVGTLDRAGEEKIIEAEGFLARCIQHEVDHLHGILYIDYVNELYSDRSGKKLKPADAAPILAQRIPIIR